MSTTMTNFGILLAVFAVLVYYPVQPASIFSAFSSSIGHQEEISYTVVRRGNGYEERLYPSKNWLCTIQPGGGDSDQIKVFLRLFDYLEGENDQKRQLKMGIPVSIESKKNAGGNTFTACFFLEEKDQLNYPTPTNPQVSIINRPEMTVFTRRFGGYATSEDDWNSEANSLRVILNKAGENIQNDIMYWNAYSAPVKFWNRRNEVWLLKE